MNNLTAEFFEDIEKIQNHSEDMEEALERLVESELFSKPAIFFGDSWNSLCGYAEYRNRNVKKYDTDWYRERLSSALFLTVCGLHQETWQALREEDGYCTEYEYWHNCTTYKYLCNAISTEIQRDLLDGLTLRERRSREENQEEGLWPTEEDDPTEPDQDAFVDEEVNVEEIALNNVLLEQIHNLVSTSDWDIITSSHGDGPELAKKYGVSEEVIWKRRERLLNNLREELGNDY